METLNSYILKVQKEVDDSSTNAQSVISQDVKEIYQEIMLSASQYLINQTFQDITTTVGTQIYTPNAFVDIVAVSYLPVGSTSHSQLNTMRFDEYVGTIDRQNGKPSRYFVQGSQILLDAPSDEAGTLRVYYVPVTSELVNAVDISLIPDRFTNVVKLGASYKYFAFDDNPKAVEYKNLYEEALRNMILQLATTQRPQSIKFF